MGENRGNNRLDAGSKIGRYEIVDLLGVGGMGEVYLAKDAQLGRKVAIKVLNEKYESHESNIQRFIQEAKAASALNHPNILTIHEIGEQNGSHYIVSEFVDGHRLRTILEKESLDLSRILNISIQVAEALSAAHSARIIHRDIKPENIVIRNDGYAKVLDFGLAKLLPEHTSLVGLEDETLKQNQTAEGLILGTVNYMSPEQAKGETVDARTDIFSLGVLIYEMVTGRKPFTGKSASETFANLINRDPEAMSRYASGVPHELQRIVSKMLRKDPDERYQTMKGLIADLKELKDGISAKNKLDRSSSDENERATHILGAPTAGAEGERAETANIHQRRYRLWGAGAAAAAVILGIAGAIWYWRAAAVNEPQIRSLAVLPLRSLDPGENFLGFGIADAVIRRISQTGQLTVRPTSAIRRYMNEDTDALTAAKDLTADAVLEGTVQRSADRLRVSVNLLRVRDGTSLWAESFDTQVKDVFAIQDNVSQQVASRLQLKLDPAQQARLSKRTTSNPVAYEFYVRGVYSYDQRGWGHPARAQNDATIDLFRNATQIEPDYALAHAKLAQAYSWKGLFIEPEEQDKWCELSGKEIAQAEALDPELAETHIAKAWLLFSGYRGYNIREAANEILLAQKIDPNIGHGDIANFYYHVGLEDLADREFQRLEEIDPTSEFWRRQVLIYYALVNRWDDYLVAKQKYFPNESIDFGYYLSKGDLATAEPLIEQEENPLYKNDAKSMLLALKGERKASEEMVPEILKNIDKRRPDYHHITYDVATIYAVDGNVTEAVKWLRETAATGNPSYTLFARDPYLDKIRRSPEFIQFMAELKPGYDSFRSEFK